MGVVLVALVFMLPGAAVLPGARVAIPSSPVAPYFIRGTLQVLAPAYPASDRGPSYRLATRLDSADDPRGGGPHRPRRP